MNKFVSKQFAKVNKILMIIIRKAKSEEWPIIAGFQLLMAEETENLRLNPEILSEGIKTVFDNPSKGCYFVAELDGKIVGSLLITYEWSDWRNKTIYWIQSVYVDNDYRRKGIFRKLYAHIQTMALSETDIGGIRLYVDKSNQKAQRTYQEIGMNGEHYQVFEWMKN
jgi:GNAT superfamily N-acetyltransferase